MLFSWPRSYTLSMLRRKASGSQFSGIYAKFSGTYTNFQGPMQNIQEPMYLPKRAKKLTARADSMHAELGVYQFKRCMLHTCQSSQFPRIKVAGVLVLPLPGTIYSR